MKKLIAISVVLALVTGAVFAQPEVGGRVESSASLIAVDLNTYSDSKYIATGGGTGELYITLAASNDDDTFSGNLRAAYQKGTIDKAYIWWKPFEAVSFFMGRDCDSLFETHNIVGWGFAGGDRLGATVEKYKFGGRAWTGGFSSGDYGLAASIKPVDGFALNLGVDYSGTVELQNRFPNYLFAQLSYAIPNIGTAAFSYNVGKENRAGEHLAFSFFSDSLVDGLGLEFGFGFSPNGWTYDEDWGASDDGAIHLGLGVSFASGDLGLKVRGYGSIAKYTGTQIIDFGADILVSYNLGIFEARFLFGLNGLMVDDSSFDNEVGFVINPYLVKDLGAGFLSFGVIYGKKDSDDKGGVSANVGMQFNF